MAGIEYSHIEINEDRSAGLSYSIAYSVEFEDSNHKKKGVFVLGFTDKKTAISIAEKIGEKIGVSSVNQFDEIVSDILGEFFNTILGHTLSNWETFGIRIKFGTPKLSYNFISNLKNMPETEEYIIKLSFKSETVILDWDDLFLLVTFSPYPESELTGKRVLVVDDSKVIRSMLSSTIEKLGMTVALAINGKEAVEKNRDFKPDLIIMDLVMPEMGGLDAMMEIRHEVPDMKFIILTSSSRKDEIVTAKMLGASDYLIKPFNMDQLVERINNILIG